MGTTVRRLVRRNRRTLAAGAAGVSILALGVALQPPRDPTTPVVVAARDLPAGHRVVAGDLAVAPVARGVVPATAAASPASLTGAVLAAPLARGEVVTAQRVLASPEFAAALPAGTSPMPLRLGDAQAAQLLAPGARIDVLATVGRALDDGAVGSGPARLVAAGVLVLAVIQPEGGGGLMGSGEDSSEPLVLVAVDPEAARALAGATHEGWTTYVMRP